MNSSLGTRLTTIYASLLAVTVLLIIVASTAALVVEQSNFVRDIFVAKKERARFVAEQSRLEGMNATDAAAQIVALSGGPGIRVTVFDRSGQFVAGDKALHPPVLDQIVRSHIQLLPPPEPWAVGTAPRRIPQALPEPFTIAAIPNGYVAFDFSPWLLLVSLTPYFVIVLLIGAAAVAISWFVGRAVVNSALRPIDEVTDSLRALAAGDYTRRRFVMAGGDEIAAFTAAYNDAAASVADAMDERRRTEERMRQFVADAGHELRTPLTVIGGYIDVLRRGAVEEPTIARQILGTMGIEREHMRGLIDRLVRLARLDSELPPRDEPIDVAELLKGQCEAVRRLDDRRVVDYSVEGADVIVADRTEIGEAIWNLVENAVKYAPDAPIHLRATRDNGRTHISVRDEGPGMTESERIHAFERFYRGDQRGEIAGTGLGLAIAKRAVERAGGTIDITSAPGQGTKVEISI